MNAKTDLLLTHDKLIQEKCGIVAIYNKTYSRELPLALTAAGGVQHRGQQGAGIAMKTRGEIEYFRGSGHLKEIFRPRVVEKLDKPCQWVIVHCRYGTNGGYDKRNLQPCIVSSKEGVKMAIAHNGEFVATDQIRKLVRKKFPPGISDTYLFAELLAQTDGVSIEKRVIQALSQVKGAYSLMIGIEDKLFVARDEHGIRPLVLGQLTDKYIVASETHALDKVGATVTREIKRGEIIKIDAGGVSVIKRGQGSGGHFCDFEWAYFGRPNSLLPTKENENDGRHPSSWLSLLAFREKCGEILASESPIKHADFVVGLPDSGISVAMGYANKVGVPYRQVIIRDHFDVNGQERLFMRDDQKKRVQRKVLGKLSLVADQRIWKDAVVVVGDDSIVRSNVSTNITKAIMSMGAREVHWIVGFPPVTHPCHLGVSMRTKEELIASKLQSNSQKIAKKIGATSVNYISHKGFIRARFQTKLIKIPKDLKDIFLVNGGCGGCLTGRYPVDKNGVVWVR